MQAHVIEWLEFGLKAIAGVWALILFTKRNKSDRAQWVTNLYEKFYENRHLKQIRDLLDCDMKMPEEAKAVVRELIHEGNSNFSDYLNFFEYVAYLWEAGQLSLEEVDGLFGYYLDCLWKIEDVKNYIASKSNSFERLYELLKVRRL